MKYRTTDVRSKKFSIIKPGPISEQSKASLVMALDVMLKQEVPSLNFDGVELYKISTFKVGMLDKAHNILFMAEDHEPLCIGLFPF